jgi:hypothetical protein
MTIRTPYPAAHTPANCVRSGQPCPETGWWQPLQTEAQGGITSSRFIAQGTTMPAGDSASTYWVRSTNARLQTDY